MAFEPFWEAPLAGAAFTDAMFVGVAGTGARFTGAMAAGAVLMEAALWAMGSLLGGFAGTGAGVCVAAIQAEDGCSCGGGAGGGSSLAGANGWGALAASKRSGSKLEYRIGGTTVHSPCGAFVPMTAWDGGA